jgi:hypothetical protein
MAAVPDSFEKALLPSILRKNFYHREEGEEGEERLIIFLPLSSPSSPSSLW